MTFLPVIERELRVRARQGVTFWVRAGVGAIGILLCVQQLLWGDSFGGAGQPGKLAFNALVGLAFLTGSLGCLATADAISWERRENTLGLLWLTRLRVWDILLGKLFSGSLVILCALAAFLPVLMLPVLAGGVSGREATRIGLVLINATLLSMMAGLLASTWHVHWFKAARGALLLVAALLLGPLVLQVLYPVPTVGLLSPLYGASFANETGAAFWISLLLGQMVIWILFARAVHSLRAAWASERAEPPASREAATPTQEPRPRVPIGATPLRWLLRRQRGTLALLWAGALSSFFFYGFQVYLPAMAGVGGVRMLGWPMSAVNTLLSGAFFAWAASRFLFEARRSGEFELLITTPLGAQTLVAEQWGYLRRLVVWPLVVMLLPSALYLIGIIWRGFPMVREVGFQLFYGLQILFGAAATVVGVIALVWVGMSCGLNARSQAMAVAQTLAWVKVPPFLLSVGWSTITTPLLGLLFSGQFAYNTYMLISIPPQIITLAYFLWLIRRARRQLPGLGRGDGTAPLGLGLDWLVHPAEALRGARHWRPS